MDFSLKKRTVLKPQKSRALSTFLIALATAALFFVPYMIMSEGYFTFFGDFNVQQIPFYQMCHEAIKSGNTNWSWTTDLGSNFIGSYSFYLLGSPFFWLTIPFPNSFVPYLMGPLLILKFACAALTAYFYIRRFTKTGEAARIGGLIYAFSGFSVYNIFFNHFHEAIIVFPLLLLALELLITENRRGVFALSVAFAAVTNYFFFFGMVVFAVIYFFVRLFSKAIKITFGRFLTLAFEAVAGLGIAAFLLVPSILAIIDNSRVSNLLLGWNGITYGKEQIYLNVIECFFFPPDLPARPVFFPGANVKWSSLGGWMPVFSMVGVFVWFMNRRGDWLKRLIGICTFMALVPFLNSAFYAFNTSYYARWFYMPILMMSLATVMLTEDKTVNWSSGFKWVLGITLGFTAVIGLFPQQDAEGNISLGLYTKSTELYKAVKNLVFDILGKESKKVEVLDTDVAFALRFWLTCLIAIVGLIILGLLIKLMKRDRKAFFNAAVACVCAISVIYANVFIATGRSHSYEIKDVMIDQLIEGSVELDNDENFRIDVFDGVDNTGMYLGYPTINAFHSVVPSSIIDFYTYVGVERSVGSRPDTDIPAIRSLLSVKYLINRDGGESFVDEDGETLMPDYEYIKTSGGYYVYENINYIPFGFSYDYYMTEEFCDTYGQESRSRMMLKAILLTDEQVDKYRFLLENIEDVNSYDYYGDDSEEEPEISLSISDGEMALDAARLKATAAYSFERDNNGFTAKVERDKKTLVFFSVPYDKGWRATVNGKPAEIEKVNKGFMAVLVDEGKSEIRFEYETPGLYDGVLITAATLVLFIIYLIASRIVVGKRQTENIYPEGERLIELWRKDDIAEAVEESFEENDDYYGNDKKDYYNEKPNTPENIPSGEGREEKGTGFKGGFTIDPSAFDDLK